MNFVSWNTKQIINENTNTYYAEELVEESISKTLKPVMNKMKKLNIGLPYRDARLFFFQFLKEKYPNLVPQGFETKKPSAKDVNAIVGQIAIEQPDLLDKFSGEFEAYSKEESSSGMDRVSDFLNVAATMRTGKGVRPSKAAAETQGYVKKDYSKLTAQEIANATTDAIKKKEAEFEAGDDVSDEKLLIKTVASSVLTKLADEDLNPQALKNVADAMTKIETLPRFKQFLDYIGKMEEYSVIHQYLSDQLDVIETNLEDMQAEKEDAEMEAQEVHSSDAEEDAERCPVTGKLRKSDEEDKDEEDEKAKKDFDGDGKLESSTAEYMGARDKAIKAAMEKEEDEEIALSPQEIARQMLIQRQQEMQNFYTQERLNRYGY